MNGSVNDIPLFIWILLPIVLLTQGTWLFIDARKRGKFPWLWGLWGMISTPLPLILYLIFERKVFRRN